MDEELRAAERAGDAERVRRLRERAGLVPFRSFQPDPDGRAWLPLEDRTYPDLGAAEEELSDWREADGCDAYLIVWDEAHGYLAVARDPSELPEPADVLLEDDERFLAGELEVRPTLLGTDGPASFWDVREDEADRYDEIHE